MKKFEKKTYFTMNGNELNDLISKNLAPLVKNPDRFKNFECVAEFEWNNYALYSASVLKSDVLSELYKNMIDQILLMPKEMKYMDYLNFYLLC